MYKTYFYLIFCRTYRPFINTSITLGFVEGNSFDDQNAHFVIKKFGVTTTTPKNVRHCGAGGHTINNIFGSERVH